MALADEEITITFGEERIHLRPSLRAAARLERRHGGFPAILRALDECSVTVIADLIGECSASTTNVPALLLTPGLAWRLTPLMPALQVFVLNLMGFDPDAEEKTEGSTDAEVHVAFAEVHTRLYRVATGWLGWTPADAWAASRCEIKEAFAGRKERFRAEFGVAGVEDKAEAPANLDDKFAALIARNATLPGAKAA